MKVPGIDFRRPIVGGEDPSFAIENIDDDPRVPIATASVRDPEDPGEELRVLPIAPERPSDLGDRGAILQCDRPDQERSVNETDARETAARKRNGHAPAF